MIKYSGIEKRKYVRLDSVFPIEFQFIDADGSPLSALQQGFTRDISEGGLCIEVNCLDRDLTNRLLHKDSMILVYVNIPLSLKGVKATAKIAWQQPDEKRPGRFRFGVSYEAIDRTEQLRIVKHARFLYYTPRVAVVMFLVLGLISGGIFLYNVNLSNKNKKLTEELVSAMAMRSQLKKELDDIGKIKEDLTRKIAEGDIRISLLEADLSTIRSAYSRFMGTKGEVIEKTPAKELEDLTKEKERLEVNLKNALSEKEELNKKVLDLAKSQDSIQTRISGLDKARDRLEEISIENMYTWLKVHQNKNIGLISSYEGDPDLKDCAFTYDQALVAVGFVLFRDFGDAKKVFDFYQRKAKEAKRAIFANAYDTTSGTVRENTRHVGPNTWLAIAVLQYTNKTNDKSYIKITNDIANWLLELQGKDGSGAIRGGDDINWVSTEHNLDAYALFDMLYKFTNEARFKEARDKILQWLKENAYSKSEYRIYRGKGDSTIATDTFAWAIAAIGPDVLKENGMNPDEILKFAENNCRVETKFTRPDGQVIDVVGFDFAKAANIARGGIVSSEWTAQMIVAFKIMANFYLGQGDAIKSKYYTDKVNLYLDQLQKLIISSPSWTGQGNWCLPYATSSNVDTGHGWRTPKGNSTGSVSGTAYAIFAKKGFNPLRLKDD